MRGFGYRNVENKLALDEDTIYYLASLSKSFTAAAAADLVEDRKAGWVTPVEDILPDSTHFNIVVKNQDYGHNSMRRDAALPMVSYLEKITDYKTRCMYITGTTPLRMRLSRS
jgi:CubicO group peptidase (beta-lactamase class C family)